MIRLQEQLQKERDFLATLESGSEFDISQVPDSASIDEKVSLL